MELYFKLKTVMNIAYILFICAYLIYIVYKNKKGA